MAACINESKRDLGHAASALIESANTHGGKDNISVILVEVSAAK